MPFGELFFQYFELCTNSGDSGLALLDIFSLHLLRYAYNRMAIG